MCYHVVIYITTVASPSRNGNKIYYSTLLRQSYRDDGQVKTRTLANLTRCQPAELAAIRLAVKHQGNLAALKAAVPDVQLKQGPSVGAVWALAELARQTGITAVLGHSRQGKLALWQVLARIIDQGSRLSAVRLARQQAVTASIGLTDFNEDNLYDNLRWLADRQEKIEDQLYKQRHSTGAPTLFLYDVTSTYLEGEHNELAAFGYNRDGKRGKRQLVVGLLCDQTGQPVAVKVFTGNTSDPVTVATQINKLKDRFGCQQVTMVGDKGMIKSGQIEQLTSHGFSYITSLTRPQIKTLLKQKTIQLSLFDDQVAEVTDQGQRYILRRNPVRAKQLALTRASKEAALLKLIKQANKYLAAHPRARTVTQVKQLQKWLIKLRLTYCQISTRQRQLHLIVDQVTKQIEVQLDGCYVITTDLPVKAADAQTVHDRYRDLKYVEAAFRTMKTIHLQVRPVYVRKEASTRGHLLVVMLAYLLVRRLQRAWRELDLTVPEGINLLREVCATEVKIGQRAALSASASASA